MTIAITTKVEKKTEITLPYFSKKENEYFAIYTETERLRIWILDDLATIACSGLSFLEEAIRGEQTTESEFIEAYNRATDIIEAKMIQKIETPK